MDYLEEEWGEQAIRNFTRKLEEKLKHLSENPEIYQASDFLEGTRRCVVTKHNTIFFTHDKKRVYIAEFWSNYQDSGKLKQE